MTSPVEIIAVHRFTGPFREGGTLSWRCTSGDWECTPDLMSKSPRMDARRSHDAHVVEALEAARRIETADIRELAIDRIAKARYELRARECNQLLHPSSRMLEFWADVPDEKRWGWREYAAAHVDALGDLLWQPSASEEGKA